MRIEEPVRRRNPLSLTPLIDVVFILLVFFMLASSFVQWREISVSVPAEGAGAPSDAPVLTVAVHPDGRLELNGQPIAREALGARLVGLELRQAESLVLLQPRGEVELQTLVGALEALTAAGARNVQLARE